MKTCNALTQDEIPYVGDSSIARRMRLTEQDIEKKIKPWLRVLDTGNTYAASTMISLASLFDKAKPGDQVLAVSYGSGAYSNATWFEVQDGIEEKRGRVPTVMDYVERKSEIRIDSYFSLSLCKGCNRIYYPARETCLASDCPGPMEKKRFPRFAKLKNVSKLPFKKRWTSNFELLENNKVLFVDADVSDLKPGVRLEGVIRRLDYEGKDGLILYGIAYRPVFREAVAVVSKPKPIAVAPTQYA